MVCAESVVLQTLEQSHDTALLPASMSAQASDEQPQAQLLSTQQPPWSGGGRISVDMRGILRLDRPILRERPSTRRSVHRLPAATTEWTGQHRRYAFAAASASHTVA